MTKEEKTKSSETTDIVAASNSGLPLHVSSCDLVLIPLPGTKGLNTGGWLGDRMARGQPSLCSGWRQLNVGPSVEIPTSKDRQQVHPKVPTSPLLFAWRA